MRPETVQWWSQLQNKMGVLKVETQDVLKVLRDENIEKLCSAQPGPVRGC